jgi:GNAT superfamily N-acetyltransferase
MFNLEIPYRAGEHDWIGCIASSLAVRSDHRGKGIAAAIGRRYLEQTQAPLLLGTGSNEPALAMWLKLGMVRLTRLWTRVRLVIPVSARQFVRHFEKRGVLAGGLARCACAATLQGVGILLRSVSNSRIRCQVHDSTDSLPSDGLEQVFGSNEVHRRFLREDLAWYFFSPTRLGARVRLVTAHESGSLVGMAAVRIAEDAPHQYDIVEFKSRRSSRDAGRAMLSTIATLAREDGASHMSVRPFAREIRASLPLGSYLPTPSTFAYVIAIHDQAVVRQFGGMYTSPGDGDFCFL